MYTFVSHLILPGYNVFGENFIRIFVKQGLLHAISPAKFLYYMVQVLKIYSKQKVNKKVVHSQETTDKLFSYSCI